MLGATTSFQLSPQSRCATAPPTSRHKLYLPPGRSHSHSHRMRIPAGFRQPSWEPLDGACSQSCAQPPSSPRRWISRWAILTLTFVQRNIVHAAPDVPLQPIDSMPGPSQHSPIRGLPQTENILPIQPRALLRPAQSAVIADEHPAPGLVVHDSHIDRRRLRSIRDVRSDLPGRESIVRGMKRISAIVARQHSSSVCRQQHAVRCSPDQRIHHSRSPQGRWSAPTSPPNRPCETDPPLFRQRQYSGSADPASALWFAAQ